MGQACTNLVQQVRRIAGAAMHEAWKAKSTESDETMNIPASIIDLSSLTPPRPPTWMLCVPTSQG